MLIEGKQNSSLHKYYMIRAEKKACFVPFGEKASGPGFSGTWVQKVHRRAISELSGGAERTWLAVGRWGWAGQAPGQPSQPGARGSAAFRPLSEPPPLTPSLILSCLPLPRKSPPLPGEAPLLPPRWRRRWRGRWRGSGRSGKLEDFFPPGDPLTTSPLRSTQVSLAELGKKA